PARFASLTLIAPGLFPKVDIPLMEKIRVGWSAIANRHAAFDIPLNDPEMFTANPARQAFIRNDPLALRTVTAAFLLASRKLDRYARQGQQPTAGGREGSPKEDTETLKRPDADSLKAGSHAEGVTCGGCPLRVFLGGQDRIIRNARTKEFVRELHWPQREIIEYPEAHHTLEFEVRPDQFFDDLVNFIREAE
ncbi:MAG TPA: hypothetical protein P5159_05340, partial [Phycisphaerae bacterium]|nr:hypothetical protein [Phycisphaerae bacterium]